MIKKYELTNETTVIGDAILNNELRELSINEKRHETKDEHND